MNLSHEQQQAAAEKIRQLMQQGIGSGEAIAIVAEELRARHQPEQGKTAQ